MLNMTPKIRFPMPLLAPFLLVTMAACSPGATPDAPAESGPMVAETLPDGAQARSLLGDFLYPAELSEEDAEGPTANLAAALADLNANPDDAKLLKTMFEVEENVKRQQKT